MKSGISFPVFTYLILRVDTLKAVEVILMAKGKQQNQASATNAQQMRQQNAQSAQGQNQTSQQFGKTEFSSETDAQQVRQKNQQAEQKKQQNSSQQQR